MVEENGNFIMAGIENLEDATLKSIEDMYQMVEEIGFLPLFQNQIPGFSVEEMSFRYGWWGENPDIDPWAWRERAAREHRVAYGKLFLGRAGFISKEWFPVFAAVRRDGYDFDSRYEDGLASRRAKMIIDTLLENEVLPSHELKALAGFGKGGEKGYESTITQLQQQTYIVACDFKRKVNKKGEEYGWAAANYTLSERIFGEENLRSWYQREQEAYDRISQRIRDRFGDVDEKYMKKLVRG